jgi:ATP-binding cassette subfamily A (ABC1) protein 3
LTTHYLDEADFLADDIAIMFKGSLRASGTSASLKHGYGDGYTVKLPYHSDVEPQISGDVHRQQSRHQTVYRVATPALVIELVENLEKQNVHDYQLSGPTMEELFIKVTGETIHTIDEPPEKENEKVVKAKAAVVEVSENNYELSEGKPISVFQQWWVLLNKRFRIFKRRWVPYFVAVAFAIAGAGVAPLLVKSITKPMICPQPSDLIYDYTSRYDFGSQHYNSDYSYSMPDLQRLKYVFGPASKVDDKRLELMASVYSTNHTRGYSSTSYGYKNGTQIKQQLLLVNTYDEFRSAVQGNWRAWAALYSQHGSSQSSYTPPTTIEGGIWMGDEGSSPTILVNMGSTRSSNQMLNMYNILTSGVGISASYYSFATTKIPSLIDVKPLMFIIYYGLIMAWQVVESYLI